VACGFAYTAAVTREGAVYTWGAGENGRLGLGDEQDKTIPGHVTELGGPLRAVKEIFAGSVHTCALLENGQVYAWGKCEYTGHGLAQVRAGVSFSVGWLVGWFVSEGRAFPS
jgi:alpha-tubulin suppressor-like RCC1 family protein